jgi:hypothetical protein
VSVVLGFSTLEIIEGTAASVSLLPTSALESGSLTTSQQMVTPLFVKNAGSVPTQTEA